MGELFNHTTLMFPDQISQSIISSVQEKAAQIQATGDFNQILDGYRICSALVLEKVLEYAPSDDDTFEYVKAVAASLRGDTVPSDKKQIVSQISDLLLKLVE
jgi:hypothetical protein